MSSWPSLDGDDLWEPEKLARQIVAAGAYPDAGLIAVDGVQFTDAGIMRQSLFPAQIARLFADGVESMSVDVSRHLLRENVIWTTSQVMIPARVLKTVGLSDPEFPLVNDWDLYLRIAEHYPATFLRHRLTRWRYHETSASGPARLRELRWGEDSIRMLAKHVRRADGDRRRAVRAALRSQVFMTAEAAYDHTKPGQRELGLGCLWRLLRWSLVSVAPAMFLLAAYSPAWLTHSLERMARAALRGLRSRPRATRPPKSTHNRRDERFRNQGCQKPEQGHRLFRNGPEELEQVGASVGCVLLPGIVVRLPRLLAHSLVETAADQSAILGRAQS